MKTQDLTWAEGEAWEYWERDNHRMKLSFRDNNNDPVVLKIDESGGLEIYTVDHTDPAYIQFETPTLAWRASLYLLGHSKPDEMIRLEKELESQVKTEKDYLISKGFVQSKYYQGSVYKDIDDVSSLVISIPDDLDDVRYVVEIEVGNLDFNDSANAAYHTVDSFDEAKAIANEILNQELL